MGQQQFVLNDRNIGPRRLRNITHLTQGREDAKARGEKEREITKGAPNHASFLIFTALSAPLRLCASALMQNAWRLKRRFSVGNVRVVASCSAA
jgi:hypothetical protein